MLTDHEGQRRGPGPGELAVVGDVIEHERQYDDGVPDGAWLLPCYSSGEPSGDAPRRAITGKSWAFLPAIVVWLP